MEQRRSEDDMKQLQDHHHRRLNPPLQSENQPHHPHPNPPQQPQKCPRCDSLNTKFCYYNNYSLSQPRYFCKACRRYWTQGGTLRNVPVGGGCRKAKRSKAAASSSSSGGENSRSQASPPPPPATGLLAHHELQVTNKEALIGNLGIPSMSSYNSGGGFLSSLAAMQFQSLTQLPPQPPFINQQVLNNVGAQFGASSNLSVLSLSSQQQTQNQRQNHEFYHMGINRDVESLYPSLDQALIQPNRFSDSWINPNLISTCTSTTNINSTGSNPSFGNSSSSTTGTTSLNPNQWPDHLPGYGSP